MVMVIPNEAEVTWLKTAFAELGVNWHNLHLYQTDLTLDEDTELVDLEAVEADFSGYSAPIFGWTGVVADGGTGKAKNVSADNVEFAHNGGGTSNDIYGYFITLKYSSVDYLLCCERFSDAPRVMDTDTDSFTVTPTITLSQEPEA